MLIARGVNGKQSPANNNDHETKNENSNDRKKTGDDVLVVCL